MPNNSTVVSQVPFVPNEALNLEIFDPHLAVRTEDDTLSTSGDGDKLKPINFVPGDPTISLVYSDVNTYLSGHLETPLLDELYDKLWLVAKKGGQSIDALHKQKVIGRRIVASEDPRLHLVCRRDTIYIKPILVCLLNHTFWTRYLSESENSKTFATCSKETIAINMPNFDRSVAVGFLRSYAFLIRHELDFTMAKECHLIPKDVDWISWSKFINKFRHLGDEHVAKRYHYGQMRISRLNWAVRIFGPKKTGKRWFYQIPHRSTLEYVTRATVSLLFIYTSVSLVLSSMQVVLSIPVDNPLFPGFEESGQQFMQGIFWMFSISILLLSGVVWILFVGTPLMAITWQILWGYKQERRRQKTKPDSSV
jgi:hypothetical protein